MAYKVLGQAAPAATTDTNIYTVPSAKEAIISMVAIANRTATDATFRIAVRPAGETIANKHYIAYDVIVAANDTSFVAAGITATTTDVITVYASSNGLSFNVFGTEVDA